MSRWHIISHWPHVFKLLSKINNISVDVIDGRNYNVYSRYTKAKLRSEVVSCLMELEQAGIWMSRVAHISPGTVVVYRISLVLEVDVVSSKVHCATGAAVNGPADPESLRDIWSLPIDDVIFLLSVGRTSEILCVNWKPRCQSGFFRGIFTIEEYDAAMVQPTFF